MPAAWQVTPFSTLRRVTKIEQSPSSSKPKYGYSVDGLLYVQDAPQSGCSGDGVTATYKQRGDRDVGLGHDLDITSNSAADMWATRYQFQMLERLQQTRYDIYKGDCLEHLKVIPDESLQLIVTSPPYNLGKEYEKKDRLESYLENQGAVIDECVRKLRPTGSICWQVGNFVENGHIVPLDIKLYPIFSDLGLKLRNRIIWYFGHGLHCSKRFSGRYEVILWFTKSDDYKFNLDPIRVPAKYPGKRYFKGKRKGELSCNPLGKNPSDIWEIPNVKHNHIEKTGHPAQFPVGMIERLVLSMTDEDDVVYDPYLGSGTSIIAALLHGRLAIGSEKEPKYVSMVRERLRQLHAGTLRTRPMDRPVYEPQ